MYRVTENFLHNGNIFTSQVTVLTHIHFCCAADFLSISTKALSLLIAALWCYLSYHIRSVVIEIGVLLMELVPKKWQKINSFSAVLRY